MTDSELLDWLQQEFESGGTLKFERYAHGKVGVELFTVGSQHVRASGSGSIRKVIESAKLKSEERQRINKEFNHGR